MSVLDTLLGSDSNENSNSEEDDRHAQDDDCSDAGNEEWAADMKNPPGSEPTQVKEEK